MAVKLGRKIGHRKSLMRNLATSLILFEKVDTTLAKAKAVKPIVEKMLSASKKNDLATYRTYLAYFFDKNAAKKIRDELSIRYKDRQSGFVRIYQTGNRLGDNAKMSRLELLDRKVFITPKNIQTNVTSDKKSDFNSTNTQANSLVVKPTKAQKISNKGGVVTRIRTKTPQKSGEK